MFDPDIREALADLSDASRAIATQHAQRISRAPIVPHAVTPQAYSDLFANNRPQLVGLLILPGAIGEDDE
jgi:hypothetical protein